MDILTRRDLITQIERARGSRVLAYICGDRRGTPAQIGDDAVRPMYEHLLALGGKVEKFDLFIYSRGGDIDVPWRIVSMIREFCDKFSVLVPFRANSAATLIALGADEIVMGGKGELGPIDPSLNRIIPGQGGAVQEQMSVEDVMSYVTFMRERAKLTDQAALVETMKQLADQIGATVLGSVFRMHSHIRTVARKMLGVRKPPVEQAVADKIVETLAERIYAHGHAIGRDEAEAIELPVEKPDAFLENVMWRLLVKYEDDLHLLDPIDPETFVAGQDERAEASTTAVLESRELTHHHHGEILVKAQRQAPPQFNLNLQVSVQLPPGLDPNNLPPSAAQVLQQIVQQAQQAAQQAALQQVQAAIKAQAPVVGYAARFRGARWEKVEP